MSPPPSPSAGSPRHQAPSTDPVATSLCSLELDLRLLTDDWGRRWELLSNTYKPYPCGIVSHPAIEAAEASHPDADRDVQLVEVIMPPIGRRTHRQPGPSDGLAARFSTIHGVACGLLDGTVDLSSYEDDHVRSAPVVAMRSRVVLTPDPESPVTPPGLRCGW